jgi:hypothetical protein
LPINQTLKLALTEVAACLGERQVEKFLTIILITLMNLIVETIKSFQRGRVYHQVLPWIQFGFAFG